MRISDWSSDVFSSDLAAVQQRQRLLRLLAEDDVDVMELDGGGVLAGHGSAPLLLVVALLAEAVEQRSEERRVGKECEVRLDSGVRRILKKKQQYTEEEEKCREEKGITEEDQEE